MTMDNTDIDEVMETYHKSWDAFLDAYLEQKKTIDAQDRLLSKMVRLKQNERFVKEYKEIPHGESVSDSLS